MSWWLYVLTVEKTTYTNRKNKRWLYVWERKKKRHIIIAKINDDCKFYCFLVMTISFWVYTFSLSGSKIWFLHADVTFLIFKSFFRKHSGKKNVTVPSTKRNDDCKKIKKRDFLQSSFRFVDSTVTSFESANDFTFYGSEMYIY